MEDKDAKIKGTVILDYARMIRANKGKDWNKYLTPEDSEIINGRILASVWYPLATFLRSGRAVFNEIAGGNLTITRQFGRLNADTLFQGTYKSTLDAIKTGGGGVVKFLERYAGMSPTFFNFITVSIDKIADHHVKLRVKVEIKANELFEPYFAQLAGTVERLAELAGGQKVKVTLLTKQWQGAPSTDYDITWE